MTFRYAIRRTQKQVDADRKARAADLPSDYRELQKLAGERGIPANQSADKLRKALSK